MNRERQVDSRQTTRLFNLFLNRGIKGLALCALVAPAFAALTEVATVPGDTLTWQIPEQWVYEGSCFYVTAVNGVGLESTPTQYCLTAEDVRNSIPNPPTGLTMVKVMP